MNVIEKVDKVYDSLALIEKAAFHDGEVLINEVSASDMGLRTLLQASGINAGMFANSSVELKNHMLREFVTSSDPAVRAKVCILEDSAIGVMPRWKADMMLTRRLIEATDAENLEHRGDILLRPDVYGFSKQHEFELADSKFFAGIHMNFELFGLKFPGIGLRIVREICTNGWVTMISQMGIDFDGDAWPTIMKTVIASVGEQAKSMPITLERMKGKKIKSLNEIVHGDIAHRIPKTVRDNAPAYVDHLKTSDDTELSRDLIDTRYGVVNILTAVARGLNNRSRDNVEATAMRYINKQAA